MLQGSPGQGTGTTQIASDLRKEGRRIKMSWTPFSRCQGCPAMYSQARQGSLNSRSKFAAYCFQHRFKVESKRLLVLLLVLENSRPDPRLMVPALLASARWGSACWCAFSFSPSPVEKYGERLTGLVQTWRIAAVY